MWYSDGVEGEVIKDMLDRFMKDNPDIKITLDNVAYKVIQEQLPIQLEAGQGPDIARVTNIKELANHWLDMRPMLSGPEILGRQFRHHAGLDAARRLECHPRLHDAADADRRLRQHDPVRTGRCGAPGRKGDVGRVGRCSRRGRKEPELPAAFAIDRSGHRISGPNISYGANYIGCRWHARAKSMTA